MKRSPFLTLLIILVTSSAFSQPLQRPKLVVGIVVDQMRPDYLDRFHDRFGTGGFRRLLREGFECSNTFIPYTPTVTAAGHTSIYTGSVPALHGIMGNSWYDPQTKKSVYCADDLSVRAVGSNSSQGQMSPRNLWASTITDELRLATNFRNKTIAIAMKDRGAIFPGGHTSNGTFWFDNATGGWISSTFYMNELPQWLQRFNEKRLADAYMARPWELLRPANTYVQSTPDSNGYETKLLGEDISFPHQVTTGSNRYEAFRYTPMGNSYTFDMARAAIEGEQLGTRGITDFLALSFSSTDLAGHSFGPNSMEVEDMYLRFDLDLAAFLSYLDTRVGKGQYLVFLTSDHAVAHNTGFLRDHKIATGAFESGKLRNLLNDTLEKRFGQRQLVETVINYQVFFNDSIIQKHRLSFSEIKEFTRAFMVRLPGVSHVLDLAQLSNETLPERVKMMVANGYNQRLSGDLQYLLQPGWSEGWRTGASHSLWNNYDARIPLLWYGWGVKKGRTTREVYMTDIAVTLAALLRVQMPNAAIGHSIPEVLR